MVSIRTWVRSQVPTISFVLFFSLQIRCASHSYVHHTPLASIQWIHHQSNPVPPAMKDHGTPSSTSTTGSSIDLGHQPWAQSQIQGCTPQICYSTHAHFLFFIYFLYLIILFNYFSIKINYLFLLIIKSTNQKITKNHFFIKYLF